jgi:hypothetical protein
MMSLRRDRTSTSLIGHALAVDRQGSNAASNGVCKVFGIPCVLLGEGRRIGPVLSVCCEARVSGRGPRVFVPHRVEIAHRDFDPITA